jgi:Holliday junction resolvase RusA-like endonuclease
MIQFTAYGIPAPKGSTKAFFRPGMKFPVVTEDNKHTRPWEAIVKDAALQEMMRKSLTMSTGPLHLHVDFHMPRPKSLPKRVSHHTKKPDLDKLLRAVKDALTGIVWHDDAQVVHVVASKDYAGGSEMPRVNVRVESVDEEERLF